MARKVDVKKTLLVSLQKYGAGPVDSLELSEALCRLRYPHAIIVSRGNELRARFADNEWRRVYAVPTFESRFTNFFLATVALARPLTLFFAVLRYGPEVVHTTHFHPWLPVVFFASRFRKAKFVYTLHDNPFAPKEHGLAARANRFEALLVRGADGVVTHSDFVKSAISPFLRGKSVRTVPLGAYAHLCGKQPPSRTRGETRFLFLGRIEPFKGLEVLAEAYKILRPRVPGARLTIAGKGKISDSFRREIERLGIRLVHRWVGAEEVCEYMADADVAVLPYRDATQSGVISLAMAYGVPVIASRVGGLPEQVIDGETGFLVPPADPSELARKMELLANDGTLRERFREHQLRLARTQFSWDESAKKLIGVWNE